MTAADVIGGTLRSSSMDVNVYGSPGGKFMRSVPSGDDIGIVYSWVEDGNGTVWYQLEAGGFVEHATGRYDEGYLLSSLADVEKKRQAKIQSAVDERLKQNASNNALYGFGKNFFNFDGIVDFLKKGFLVVLGVLLLWSIIKFVISKIF
jgi:hypothetical protein